MTRDLFNKIKISRAIDPVVVTNSDAAQVGQIVDHAGYESGAYVIQTGALSDANAVFQVKVDEGDDPALADAAAVPAALLQLDGGFDGVATGSNQAAFTFAKDNAQLKVGYKGYKRYTRLTITPVGNDAGSAPLSAAFVNANPRHASPGAGDAQKP
jgi:hypothetical protein